MMKITKIKFSREALSKIPERERILFVSLAHAANELNVLSKLYQIAMNPPQNEIERKAMVVQAFLIGKMLAGKLYETWNLFTKAYFGTKISKIYEPLFDSDAQNSLKFLKNYFNNENVISLVRNRFAFHYGADQIQGGFEAMEHDAILDMYLDAYNPNTMYSFADDIVNFAMFEAIAPGDQKLAVKKFMDDTSAVNGHFSTLLGACMAIAIAKYLSDEAAPENRSNFVISNAPNWKELRLHYFSQSPTHFSFPLKTGESLEWGNTSLHSPKITGD